MKTVVLMRHAKAGPEKAAEQDFDRSLTDDGRKVALLTAQQLSEAGIAIDRVIVSAARRTTETGQIVADAVCRDAPLLVREDLYHAPAETYAASIGQSAAAADQTVLIVGHNPGIGKLMSLWAGTFLPVSPATAMVFRFDVADWTEVPVHGPVCCHFDFRIAHGHRVRPE